MPHPLIIELQALLEKHKASIYWDCHWSSDLHGVTDQQMVITTDGKEVARVGGASVDATDLTEGN